MKRSSLILVAFLGACGIGHTEDEPVDDAPRPAILPVPRTVSLTDRTLALPPTLRCHLSHASLRPLVAVLDYEYGMRTGGRVEEAASFDDADCRLTNEPLLGDQHYRITIDSTVNVTGGSYAAVAMGTATIMQMLEPGPGGAVIATGFVDDEPRMPYRGLLIDVARNWHDVEVLEQLVLLCRWYKVNYLQLHLTDDQLFTFPTERFPSLPTPAYHYTREELRRLDDFARDRGVTLLPEVELPGHGAQFTDRMPELFALADRERNPSTLNIGRESAYAALDTLLGEVASVFQNTPFIHIGADEVSFEAFDEDPDVQRYLAAHSLDDAHELYRHFIVRMNEIVKKHGKRTLLWEGFGKEGRVDIPRDITVMAWETIYQLPQDLIAGGYRIINASWKPLYVVNEKKWDVESIYAWNLWRWENWVEHMPSYSPIQLEPTPAVYGASLESWDQVQHIVLPSVRRRLAAMSERTWNASLERIDADRPVSAFLDDLALTDSALQEIVSPVRIHADGVRYPELREGHYNEEYWFADTLTLRLEASPELEVRYTLDGSAVDDSSPLHQAPIRLTETSELRARAYTSAGEPVGYERWHVFEARPIDATITGELVTPLDELWEKMDQRVQFVDSVTVTLSALRPGLIRYTMDGSDPSARSTAYSSPIVVDSTLTLQAQLFDTQGRALGQRWTQGFHR